MCMRMHVCVCVYVCVSVRVSFYVCIPQVFSACGGQERTVSSLEIKF